MGKNQIAFIFILIVIYSQLSYSATYRAVSIHGQISESNGIVVGTYLGESFKRLSDGNIVTEATFSIEKISGLQNEKLKNPKEFKVHFPGGKWQGIVYQYEGMPKFISGNKYLLLVAEDSYGFGLTNQSLGVYDIKRHGHSEWLVTSSVFPEHEELGNLNLETVNLLSQEILNESLREPNSEKNVYINKKTTRLSKNERMPASLDEDRKSEDEKTDTIWIVLLFSLIGFATLVLNNKKRG